MDMRKFLPLIARTFLAAIFIHTGVANGLNFAGTQQMIAGAGIPLAFLVALCTVIFEILGGISLILGYKANLGAILLLIFLIPATLVFHNPIGDPGQTIAFLKNLGLMGGLLMVIAYGPGPISFRTRTISQTEPVYSSKAEE